ncbi:MAG: Asp-tRNA(Asn)/Glu-tRNA(Gln) amidotransferase subunit GatC [Candidatus Nitrosocosmicus sp.]
MSDNEDIKKLCILSRLEIDGSEIHQTADKIKEILSFFNKLDEFEFDSNVNADNNIINQNLSMDKISCDNKNFLRNEKNLDNLRLDEPNNIKEKTKQQFTFNFHHQKNGYVIGPRI